MTTIIEPCCAERQLPSLLREQKGRAVLFQTYGDVTFDNILKSVSCMAGNDHLTLTLATREVTDRMQRTLQRYQQRQWITTLRVITDDLAGEAICIEGTLGTVIIQGPIQDTAAQRGTPVLYAGQFCPLRATVAAASPAVQHPLVKLLDARLRRQSSLADLETPANRGTAIMQGDTEPLASVAAVTVAGASPSVASPAVSPAGDKKKRKRKEKSEIPINQEKAKE